MTGLEVGSESLDTAQQALESVNQENSETSTQTPRLLSVPLELIRQILGNLSYDDIKRVRQVNKQLSAVTGYLVFAQIPLKIKEDALKEYINNPTIKSPSANISIDLQRRSRSLISGTAFKA